jgi:glutamate synthase domain-containing protein 1
MKKISTMHKEWMKHANYRKEYLALKEEFAELVQKIESQQSDGKAKTNSFRERL